MKYSDVATPSVPPPQRERRDLLLAFIHANDGLAARELVHRLRHLVRDYNYDLCLGDLRQLERYGLVYSAGHPKRWSAVVREFGRSWTLREAVEWFREHADAARVQGWTLSLCGSTLLRMVGRDLDVIATPTACDAVDLCARWDASEWNVIHQRVTSPSGVEARVYEDAQGRLIDITFFPVRPVHPEIQVQMREEKHHHGR